MARRLIPERTIDGWMSYELGARDPEALIWLPTPNMQAEEQPWDVSVQAFGPPAKLLVYENKALEEGPSVSVRFDQLLAMIELSARYGFFFYALPGLSEDQISGEEGSASHRAKLRLAPIPFGDWLHILSPLEVLGSLPSTASKAFARNLKEAIAGGDSVVRGRGTIPTQQISAFPSLVDHLNVARACESGRLIDAGDLGTPVGLVLPPHQRVRIVGRAVLALLEGPTAALLDELGGQQVFDVNSPEVAEVSVSTRQTDVARHLLRTTWVAVKPK